LCHHIKVTAEASQCAGELAELLELSEGVMVDRMLKHALPPLVEAGNRAALEALAAKAGTDPPTLLHNYGHTIIAKCLYEGEALHRRHLPRHDLFARSSWLRWRLYSRRLASEETQLL
jgi:hypothetical protein